MAKKKQTQEQEPTSSFLDRYAGIGAAIGFVLIVVGLCMWFIAGAKFPPRWAYAVLAVGVLLVVAMVSSKPELLRVLPGARQLKYGSNALVSLVLLFMVLVFVNYLATRYKHRFDLTKEQSNTLSPQTRRILREKVKGPLNVTYYYESKRTGLSADVQRLLRNYEGNSRNVHVEFVDVIKDLQRARRDGVFVVPTTVVKYPKVPNAQDRLMQPPDEPALTGSILKLTAPKRKRVYFMQGHGEREVNGFDEDSFSNAKSALEKINYVVDNLPVLQKGMSISPEEAKAEPTKDKTQTEPKDKIQGVNVLVITGPRIDLKPEEASILRAYLNAGGKLLLLLDPPETRQHQPKMPQFEKFLNDYGMDVLPGMLARPALDILSRQVVPLLGFDLLPGSASTHSILRGVPGACTFVGVLPLKRKTPSPSGQTYTPLMQNVPAIPDMVAASLVDGEPKITGKDPKGPFDVAFALEPMSAEKHLRWRTVVVGDSDWSSNRYFAQSFSNQSLFTSIVNWLSEEEALIDVTAKPPITNSFGTLGQGEMSEIVRTVLVLVFAVPVGVLVCGTVVWWQRRR